MSDLEWYLDVGGKQSGPHSAREIVEMVRGGKIPANSQVTAARMNGDWVRAQDLIEAYDELYAKPPATAAPKPMDGTAAFQSNPADPNYTAPPRPTEQLEKSKVFTLNREELDRTPDPTEALFQAIQAVREKANQKSGAPTSTTAMSRESFGPSSQPSRPRIPPQLLLILVMAAIFGVTIFALVKLVGGKKTEEAAKTPAAVIRRNDDTPARPPPPQNGSLLNNQGNGSNAARTTPPVSPHGMTSRTVPTRPRDERLYNNKRNTGGGGARYRDERDAPIENEPDVDESDLEAPTRELPEPMPVDPSQVPSDRIIPEPGMIPGRGPFPGSDPYIPPPPAGAPQ